MPAPTGRDWVGELARAAGITDPAGLEAVSNYWRQIHEGAPQYEGSYEMHQQQLQDFVNRYKETAAMEQMGAPGVAELGDAHQSARQMLMEILAGRGMSGSGIEAQALSNLTGMQGQDLGQLFQNWDLQKLFMGRDDRQRDEDWARQMLMQNLMMQQQDSGGSFLGDILGLGASFLPFAGGLFGGGGGKGLPPRPRFA